MRKTKFPEFNIDDSVIITSYNPPYEGKVVDMYYIPSKMVLDNRVKQQYPIEVPIVEVTIVGTGKVMSFVKDVVKKG